jgi:HSP20 family protein
MIILDIPGLDKEDISLSRQNAITIVKGNRRKNSQGDESSYEKNERKYGEFTMTFKIPDIYERKWEGYHVEKGVLSVWYPKDLNDEDVIKKESPTKSNE